MYAPNSQRVSWACCDEIGPGVLLQVGELAKAFLAVGTAVRLDAQVYAQVLGQVRRIRKGLSAVRTLVGLRVRVRFGVDLHVGLGEEGQRTHFTPVEHTGDTCQGHAQRLIYIFHPDEMQISYILTFTKHL